MNNIEKLTIAGRQVLQRPSADQSNSKGTLVILHGYGADEYDLMGLAPYFDANLQILSVRGPGTVMYGGASWFDIDMYADGSLKFNVEQALESAQGLIELIAQFKEQGIITEEKIILAGFSQGATISQLVTLIAPDLIKALLIMSGRLTEQTLELLKDPTMLNGLPVFAGHGADDNVIPIEFGRQIVAFWENLPVRFEHHEYPMGHEICQAELGHIQGWMNTKVLIR
jgi:phospholipase/carboxylesterase